MHLAAIRQHYKQGIQSVVRLIEYLEMQIESLTLARNSDFHIFCLGNNGRPAEKQNRPIKPNTELGKTGTKIGRGKIRRLMQEENLKAIHAKAFKQKTTDSKGTTAVQNLLAQIKLAECEPRKIII